MRQALTTRGDLTSYAVTAIEDVDVPTLMALLDAAWQADYHDQVRLAFDETFLRWLMVAPEWVGIVLCTRDGTPVGFEMALARTLYCHQHPLAAYYATLFTVAPEYRRQGLGQWLLEELNQQVFGVRGAAVLFSVFHSGHAGSPTVQATFDRLADWGVQRFHTSPIWGLRLDRAPLPPLDHQVAAMRVGLPRGETHLTPQPPDTSFSVNNLPEVTTLTADLAAHYQVFFGFDKSFRTQYLQPGIKHSGTFWYTFEPGSYCSLSFHLNMLQRNEQYLGRAGQIQTVYATHCTAAHLQQALHHLGRWLQDEGCFAVTLLDQGVIPHHVLQTLHFRPGEDQMLFAVRGPRSSIAAFTTVQPPYGLDFC